ncbi:MAG: hypothetical protein E6X19_17945 [Hungatella hathewayi]|jgi:hypothetical protein|uniref:hypothetical protein n=1 Tax=Hungatella TaxID=1649459 RepID=UPI0011DD1462|nr:hypothetical protein [Hungatella hathewayi]MDU4974587.1 hypothetical protein [Hungatella hathewayi]
MNPILGQRESTAPQIPMPEDYLIYGASEFPYPLLAVNASYYGYIYAMGDEAQRNIIYVEVTFCNYFTDIDYENVIPEKYLPIGFDAKQNNPVHLEFKAEIERSARQTAVFIGLSGVIR